VSGREKIVVVDDDEAIRRNFKDMLDDMGYLTVAAADGREALEVFAREQPALVLTDLRMPEHDGIGLISALKELSPDTPVVVVSGAGTTQDAIDAIRQGAWDYVTKPVQEPAVLDLTIKRALERARLLTENRTYQKHLEELVAERTRALVEEQLFHRATVEALPDFFCVIDEHRRFVRMNSRLMKLHGLDPSTVNQGQVFRFIHPDDLPRIEAAYAAALAGKDVEFEAPFAVSSEKLFWCRVVARSMVIDNHRYVVVYGTDVTARRQAEETLAASEQLHRAMTDNISDVIAIMRADGVMTYKSPNITRWFGWQPEDLVGSDGWHTVHPDDMERVQQEFGALLAAGPQATRTVEYRYKCRNDTYRWIELTAANMLSNPAIGGVLMNYHDITERRVAQEALRESDARARATLNAIPDLMFRLNRDGVFVDYKANIADLYMQTAPTLVGRSYRDIFPEEFADFVERQVRVAFDTGALHAFEYSLPIPGRGERAYEARMMASGADEVTTIVRDITDRKAAEARLQEALAEVTRLRDRLQDENLYLRKEVGVLCGHGAILGQSAPLQLVLGQVEQVAPANSTVLLLGETGTGKELFATAIHERSLRRERPMVRVNCAALSPTLIEGELFGREKGAYTGAQTKQIGRFELATGSTIFLDEIGDLPLEAQVKLLRVLQERQIERLGSPTPIKIDTRVIAATNRDLAAEVSAGRFRQDLYYRLNVFPIVVPPLRARREDIPVLVWAFVDEFGKNMGKSVDSIPEADMSALCQYDWPGNIRELRNIVERSMIVATGSKLHILAPVNLTPSAATPAAGSVSDRETYIKVLKQCGWRIRGEDGAAQALGLKPTTLETRLVKLGIRRPGKS
jgi:formate hydrogenlyase transcriptional activator